MSQEFEELGSTAELGGKGMDVQTAVNGEVDVAFGLFAAVARRRYRSVVNFGA